MFNKVSEIELPLVDSGVRAVYITFDQDWCHEEVLLDSLSLIEEYQATATIFLTNRLSYMNLLYNNQSIELGIHPNINPLIDGNCCSSDNAEEIIDGLLSLVPAARSVRSHSLVTSSRLTELFFLKGLTHESNIKIPLVAAPSITPFRHPSGMIMCPFQWGDYADRTSSFRSLTLPNYFMVNFHPIHVFLNTESIDRYERTRPLHQNPKELIKHRFEGYGTRNRLIELLELPINQ